MKMRLFRLLAVILTLGLALTLGCKLNQPKSPETAKISPLMTVAVAPFSVAHESYELLGGYLPDYAMAPKSESMSDLDAIMAESLHVSPETNFIPPTKVKDCLAKTHRPAETTRQATVKFWQSVGQCQDAMFILVPMVSHWKEREGSPAGSTNPAWVILDLYLVNARTGQVANHFHYDYQQRALTDNILEVDKFFKRRGQWVKAEDLAREGIEKGLKELGLK